MITNHAIPIPENWPTTWPDQSSPFRSTAHEVNSLLARIEVDDIQPSLVPHLAAAAAELALVAGIAWRFSVDDAPVALLRLIAKVAITKPQSCGPHTACLCVLLEQTLS